MHVSRLALVDFRSYSDVDTSLEPGVSVFIGPNGQGKTNLVEAVDYAATQGSHRVSGSEPLVRHGCDRAIVRTTVERDGRQALVELEINPARATRARLNRAELPRAREALGILRTVVFSPQDIDLVRGDPSGRRRFLDDLLVARAPRFAGVRSDYDRVLRQRNSLLKTAGGRHSGKRNDAALSTLDAWDAHLARTGAELLVARLELVCALNPHATARYHDVSMGVSKPAEGNTASLAYRPSLPLGSVSGRAAITDALLTEITRRRDEELERGVTLVGPHRDDLELRLGGLPARGYASHGESWSFALALRLAAFEVLRSDGDDPVLILDDVFAELDDQRRDRLAALITGAEQVLVTAAVLADVPAGVVDQRYDVGDGKVARV